MADQTNTAFIRLMLRVTMRDVKARFAVATRKASWTANTGLGCWEFHINKCVEMPEGFYWYGHADNAYHARVLGWSEALAKHGGR